MAELRLAHVTHEDLPALAEVHRRAFPDSAITAFGAQAVRRYYAWLLDGPHDAALIGAFRGEELVGFCAAGTFRGAMSGFLRRNRAYLAACMLRRPALVLSPLVRERIRKGLRITLRSSRVAPAPAPSTGPERFGVLAIATAPEVRGSGAGRALMLDAEARARAAGHRAMTLTVHPDNTRAVAFYEGLGWTRRSDAGEPWHGKMEKPLI